MKIISSDGQVLEHCWSSWLLRPWFSRNFFSANTEVMFFKIQHNRKQKRDATVRLSLGPLVFRRTHRSIYCSRLFNGSEQLSVYIPSEGVYKNKKFLPTGGRQVENFNWARKCIVVHQKNGKVYSSALRHKDT